MAIGIYINIFFFAGMGLLALAKPRSVVAFVDIVPSTAEARNEVRAVYGGFGLAIAGALALATINLDFRSGILLAVALAVLGMAAGRLFSFLSERTNKWPVLACIMEAALGILLLINL